jgi:hypothetical protein
MTYFQPQWPAFQLEERSYDLSHLDEYSFEIADSKGTQRHIIVTFEDHCFTRKLEEQDEPELRFPGCSRNPGVFCLERYEHSLRIREHIAEATRGDVWIADGEGFATIPTIDSKGGRTLYCILFDLQKVKGLPFDLRMLVRTSYPLNEKSYFSTHGYVRFRHLVTLRLSGKMPPRNRDARRKRPQIK